MSDRGHPFPFLAIAFPISEDQIVRKIYRVSGPRNTRWGKFDTNTWLTDHAEEVGHNLDNLILPTAFPYLAKYDQIVTNVSAV